MKNKELRERIVNVISDSTLHGFPRVLKSNSWIAKLMWVVCFLCSLGYCFFMVIEAILKFLRYETVMSTNIFKENPSSFPVITICNLNQFQTNDSFDIVKKYTGYQVLNYQKNFIIINELFGYNETLRKSISFSLNDTLISCVFNSIPCSVANFTWIFMVYYGDYI